MKIKVIKLKSKLLIATSLLFFLIVNTNYFWEAKLGRLSMLITFFLFSIYITFIFILLAQLYYGIKEDFKNIKRLFCIGIIFIVLLLTYLKPFGLINFEKFESKDLLIAYKEGVANCSTRLKLKENGKFNERNVCFEISEISGEYVLKNDTIFFKNINSEQNEKYYEFAIIKKVNISNSNKIKLIRYNNQNDTIGNILWIKKNELNK